MSENATPDGGLEARLAAVLRDIPESFWDVAVWVKDGNWLAGSLDVADRKRIATHVTVALASEATDPGAGETVTEQWVFTYDRIASDREGYYYDRWDLAVRIRVSAANEAAAKKKAFAVAEAPRGKFWKIRLKSVEPAALQPVATEERP
jgi:hypothetical protein